MSTIDQKIKNSSSARRRVAIIGGGLVGSLSTIYFAKRGWEVLLFELRKDPRLEDKTSLSQRSINLALSARGISALKNAGSNLDEVVLSQVAPMKGRMIHRRKGGLLSQLYGVFGECIYSVDRATLLGLLLDDAEKSENVKIYFEHQLKQCDFDARVLDVENKNDGTISKYEADLIVGADGAYSTVRSQLMRVVRMNYQQEFIPHAYCELTIPPKKNAKGEFEFAMDPNHLHIWPRHTFMMIALPNLDKSFTCTLFMPYEKFDAIKTEDDLITFYQLYFTDAIPLIGEQNLKRDYFLNPKGSLISIKCDPYNYKDRAVIIGDAAHSMVPFYGQGMNCGFQDVEILDKIFEQHNINSQKPEININTFNTNSAKEQENDDMKFRKDLERALDEYTRYRHIDVTTICDLAMYNYIEMRSSVISPIYITRKKIEEWLHWLFPSRIIPLYPMVSFTDMRYSDAQRRWKRQNFLINVIAGSTVLATFAALVLGLRCGRCNIQNVNYKDSMVSIIKNIYEKISRKIF
ncbi:10990_t:CDS:2 [Ambispora leptoticha]|uniref:Kynurenine 3-monooxygenase n=1 Tax=Ambispora leptoticha TaxID=144679 RepID=A0A9N8VDH3_9GLOM|nr:10990_t:CDS:2 [Ambispora leptoticha]